MSKYNKSGVNYKKHFPLWEPRESQCQAIDFALDAYLNQGKRFVIIEAPTGVGKSLIGYCISDTLQALNWHNGNQEDTKKEQYQEGAWFLTTQKILQDQYVRDFGVPKMDMINLKSARNYQCKYFKSNTCAESLALLRISKKNKAFMNSCGQHCCYRQQKRKFMRSQKSVTNFSFFLTATSYVHNDNFKARKLLVIDEAHNIESEISKHTEVKVSEKFATQILGLKWISDEDKSNIKKSKDWVYNVYYESLVREKNKISEVVKQMGEAAKEDNDGYNKLIKRKEMLDSHAEKVLDFCNIFDEENWVMNVIPKFGKKQEFLEFKPVDISRYSEQKLFQYGELVLMMSATILNKKVFCEQNGIPLDQTAFISLESPFPKENRPIYFIDAGSMSRANIDKSLPNMLEIATSLAEDNHPNEKGIIHSRTYEITKYFKTKSKGKFAKRLISHQSEDRDAVIEKFSKSKKANILISPSSVEGLDLKGDLSRFQIICKLQFPYMGDELVKRRMERNKDWYAYETAKALVQSLGRSVRSSDDYAVTYILDGSFLRFFQMNKKMIPKYILETIEII